VARVDEPQDGLPGWKWQTDELGSARVVLFGQGGCRAGLARGGRLDVLGERLSAMLAFGDRPISLVPPPADSVAAKIAERVGPFAGFARSQREADELIFELIEERRDSAQTRDDVLAMLLDARHQDGSEMSREELRDELMTLLVAGHETTASALAWTFERLSREGRVLRSLLGELDAGDGDAYLTATIQEALRRRPVLPNAAPRLVVREVEVGGWLYAPGVCLVPNAYLVHHDASIYSDPYAFRPERFLERQPGTYTWIPFGGGRRRCLGASFAMLEMKLVLRTVLRARQLRPTGDGPGRPRRRNITMTPARGTVAGLSSRTRSLTSA